MIPSVLKGQRGGLAILTALGFLLFSIPLITASLDLAQVTSIDARVKTDIMQEQYCGLAAEEYLDYLVMDNTRWSNWLAANIDLILDPLGHTSTETITPCGEDITITVVQQLVLPPGSTTDPLGNPLVTIPSIGPFNKWKFQALITVDNSNPNGGDTVIYTITVINRSDQGKKLDEIKADIPPEFTYDCTAPTAQITLPNAEPIGFNPAKFDNELCDGQPDEGDDNIKWKMGDLSDGKPTIEPGEVVTLTFTVVTSVTAGTYCAQAKVKPSENESRSGLTANVQIGPDPGICSGKPVAVSLTVDSADLVSTDTTASPFIYTFDIGFTMTITNTGAGTINIHDIEDLLPVGFSQLLIDPSGDITNGLKSGTPEWESSVNRFKYEWSFSPRPEIESGMSKTIKYSTVAIITNGTYWTDLIVDIHPTDIKDNYTWPTAFLFVKDVFDVTVTDSDGNELPIALQVWIGDQNGVIDSWSLR